MTIGNSSASHYTDNRIVTIPEHGFLRFNGNECRAKIKWNRAFNIYTIEALFVRNSNFDKDNYLAFEGKAVVPNDSDPQKHHTMFLFVSAQAEMGFHKVFYYIEPLSDSSESGGDLLAITPRLLTTLAQNIDLLLSQ